MTARRTSDVGSGHDRRRKAIVEPVFGHIKEALGFRRFSLRARDLARSEQRLMCLAHNPLKPCRYGAVRA